MIQYNKKLRFGASIPSYNRDWYLGPFLEQLVNKDVKCVVALGNQPFGHEGKQEDTTPDNTRQLLDTYFPQVEVITGNYSHHRDSMNAGFDQNKFNDCDVVIVTDCDIYMESKDWDKFFNWVSDNIQHDVFSIDFEKMIYEYYYDYRFGKGARPGGDPPIMAIKPNIRMKHMTKASEGSEVIWNDPSVTVHHLRWTCHKGKDRGELYNRPPQSALHEYTPAPEEITNSFHKWEKILETL